MDIELRVRRHENGKIDVKMSYEGDDIGMWGGISEDETLKRILQIVDHSIKRRKEHKDGYRTTV